MKFDQGASLVPNAERICSLSDESLFILPRSASFVKNFFNFFRSFSTSNKFFIALSELFEQVRHPSGQLIYYTASKITCQHLFFIRCQVFSVRAAAPREAA